MLLILRLATALITLWICTCLSGSSRTLRKFGHSLRVKIGQNDWLSLYYPKTVIAEKSDHVSVFLDPELILRYHHAYVFVSKEWVLYLRNMA